MSSRLLKEYRQYQKEQANASSDADRQIVLNPVEDNLFSWTATIMGPAKTPYETGRFALKIDVPDNYPMNPPSVKFVTPIFHPNIHFKTGEVCLDTIKSSWTPAWTLQSVCRAIIVLLSHPEPESPLNCDCGNLMRCGDVRGFNSLASMYTKMYASL
eukprot:GFYU01003373.1.p1 GENE.GFYU01003373.1~~GFYU01003373.1.p1  ORF type:complete len:157 (-),score=18.79 GFYU01003373.1:56-526(-)